MDVWSKVLVAGAASISSDASCGFSHYGLSSPLQVSTQYEENPTQASAFFSWFLKSCASLGESATQGAEESEKIPVENYDASSSGAGSSAQPQQALSLVCDE